ncbi:phosphoribosylformylglycinamidine synthase subunit PurQ [Roseospirillum parvum]|uniref:Phosphoribosylformylglycinamidine synthase subunit PurQ n=1 Tax=Roseospirillum parvum TaxID=83401 RepID=A0A1G7UMC0_9PROT|nr:phosphoribosylformylglycinamidine synthase subunit PurQ [Roseospirillum parvum]SDG48508.1 phosphoribosylformylglycinamidine synthase [Roseospirillum parvum]
MRAAVIVFPGSNCDRDVAVSLRAATGHDPIMHWHADTELPKVDLIVLPGGFSHGDYLRSGAMAAHAPVMREVKARADQGVAVLGICNGFQVLTECGLLPGVLMRNQSLRFICRDVFLRVEATDTPFTAHYAPDQVIRVPVAHHDGNYFADPATLDLLEGEGRVAFRYTDADGTASAAANPNGSRRNIAGVLSANRRVLGLMPHPERLADPLLGGTDGAPLFSALAESLAA